MKITFLCSKQGENIKKLVGSAAKYQIGKNSKITSLITIKFILLHTQIFHMADFAPNLGPFCSKTLLC